MGVCNCSMFCCTLLYVHSSIAIILMGKRELVDLLNCLPGVSWWLSGSSSRCHGVVCGLWLWYWLIVPTYYFWTALMACWRRSYISKIGRRQRPGINTIMYHTWPRTPLGKVTKTQENITNRSCKMLAFPTRWPKTNTNHKKDPQKKQLDNYWRT